MKKCLLIILSLVVVAGMILGSCGEPEETTTPPPTTTTAPPTTTTTAPPTTTTTTTAPPTTTTTEPADPLGDLAKPAGGKDGGWLILPASAEISNIGHTAEISNPGDAGYSFVCTEGLLRTDNAGNIKPFLAESWSIADDGSYVEFVLRQGIKFHDGVDFNAEAVKVNVDIQLEQEVWTNLYPFESTEIIDDYTIRLHFDNDKYDWGAVTSLATFFSCKMFSPDFLLNETDEYKRSHVVGTGPFILDEYARGQYIKYVRNDDYWRGKPYLEGIEYRILPQPETQLLAFKSGELHFLAVQARDAGDMITEGYDVRESYDFVFNGGLMFSAANPDSPWADIRVRQAAAHAVNQALLIEGLTYGYGKPSNQVFLEGQAWYNPDTVGYDYNLDMARQLLADADLANGFDTTWYMLDFMNLDTPIAVQDMLREIDINVEFELISMPVFNTMVAEGWEGLVWGGVFAGAAVEPSSCMVNGVLNGVTTWVAAIQPDELYQQALAAGNELDMAVRAQMYQAISKSLTDDYCQIAYLPYMPGISAYSPVLKGYELGYSSFQYTFAWLDE